MSYFSWVNHAHELVNEIVLWIVLIYVSGWCFVLTNTAKDLGDLPESKRWRFRQRVEEMRDEVLRRSKHDQMVIRICLLACAIIDGVTLNVLFASRWYWLLCIILAVVVTSSPGQRMLPNRMTHSNAKGIDSNVLYHGALFHRALCYHTVCGVWWAFITFYFTVKFIPFNTNNSN